MSSAADGELQARRWRRLRRDIGLAAEHTAYPGELGEYATLMLDRGRELAEAVFPRLSRHLQTCSRCTTELQVLIAHL